MFFIPFLSNANCSHLSGYRDSAPVRIGNGAAFHQQFDIYGELMDGIYLYNKYGKPVTWEQWVSIREILGTIILRSHASLANITTDYVLTIYKRISPASTLPIQLTSSRT